MVSTLQALRSGSEVLLATMDVFLNEPVMDWISEGADRQKKSKRGGKASFAVCRCEMRDVKLERSSRIFVFIQRGSVRVYIVRVWVAPNTRDRHPRGLSLRRATHRQNKTPEVPASTLGEVHRRSFTLSSHADRTIWPLPRR